jgi:glycosyltransferase involved in cell wall biosynthesis
VPEAGKLSCVVCTYNEATRIGPVLAAAARHPLIDQLVVVDDGSTDGSRELLASRPDLSLISYRQNRGKSYALAQGLAAVSSEFVMLLDADLAGLGAEQLSDLAEPVLSGAADASVSLRANSLALYRAIGLDFVSGERVLPAALLRDCRAQFETLPGWGAEAFINEIIIREHLRLRVVRWPHVSNTRKAEKLGSWRGAAAEMTMIAQAAAVLNPLGLLRQNLQLLELTQGRRYGARPSRRRVVACRG